VIHSSKTVLVVDDDDAVRAVLEASLPAHLERFSVRRRATDAEAIDVLRTRPVDVLVTDVSMPVMDGFDLLAYVRNHHPNLPVVVMSVMAPDDVRVGAPSLGILRIVRKPTSPSEIARHVLEAQADVVKGRMSDVPLDTLLRLMKLERKSCSLLVRSGDEKGRLHFLSGDLVNAYAFGLDVDGDAAARHLLALDTVTIDFERSLHNHERNIHTPLETLLLEVATQRDEALRDRRRGDGRRPRRRRTHVHHWPMATRSPSRRPTTARASAPRIDVAGALDAAAVVARRPARAHGEHHAADGGRGAGDRACRRADAGRRRQEWGRRSRTIGASPRRGARSPPSRSGWLGRPRRSRPTLTRQRPEPPDVPGRSYRVEPRHVLILGLTCPRLHAGTPGERGT
jgi:CheY-like chemotaxis protein